MGKNFNNPEKPTIIREVHLEELEQGLTNLGEYEQAFIVFRFQGAVIGQTWLSVKDGCISADVLRTSLPAMAWLIWQRLMAPDPAPTEPLPTASVVVCTRDRTADLERCLPSLQALADQGYEVLVVDNCPSDDSTAHLVSCYPAISYLYEARPGLDVARNRGLQATSGEIIAFTDDDAIVDPEWLAALLRNFDDPMVAIVTGITLPLELESRAQLWFEWTNGFGRGFERKTFDLATMEPLAAGQVGAGVNMAIRRSVLDDIGWFDEALDGGTPALSGGDQEFFYRALAYGYRIVYEPQALVWHRHRHEWDSLHRNLYGYGVGLLAWWTRAFLEEKEWQLLKIAPSWFWQYHIHNLVYALLQRPKHIPLDLAWAEFWGALKGPLAYRHSRRLRQQQPVSQKLDRQLPTQLKQVSSAKVNQSSVQTVDSPAEVS